MVSKFWEKIIEKVLINQYELNEDEICYGEFPQIDKILSFKVLDLYKMKNNSIATLKVCWYLADRLQIDNVVIVFKKEKSNGQYRFAVYDANRYPDSFGTEVLVPGIFDECTQSALKEDQRPKRISLNRSHSRLSNESKSGIESLKNFVKTDGKEEKNDKSSQKKSNKLNKDKDGKEF